MRFAISRRNRWDTDDGDSDSDEQHCYTEYRQYRGPGGVRTSQLVQIRSNQYCGPTSSTSRFGPVQGQISYGSYTDMQVAVRKRKASNQNSSRAKHRTKVLKILNKGTLKDLTKLSTVGEKSAEQIITYRMFMGPYKRLSDLEKIPGWNGTRFERFMEANQLND